MTGTPTRKSVTSILIFVAVLGVVGLAIADAFRGHGVAADRPDLSETDPTPKAPSLTLPGILDGPPTTIAVSSRSQLDIRRGETASLIIRVKPAAPCTVIVLDPSATTRLGEASLRRTEAKNWMTWKWRVGAHAPAGSWPIIVTCGATRLQTSATVR